MIKQEGILDNTSSSKYQTVALKYIRKGWILYL